MSNEALRLEHVGRHEVQYAIVNLARDKEFSKLIDQELPLLEESLTIRFASHPISFVHSLYRALDRYYLSIELKLNSKELNLKVLLNDSGPAFVIEGSNDQKYFLLSAKRVKETLLDLIRDKFSTAMN